MGLEVGAAGQRKPRRPSGKKGSARFVIKLPGKRRKNVARDVSAKPGPGRH
jgi:hypothetical protein